MPLIMKVKQNLLWCPVIVCDHCNEEITNANDGNYQFKFTIGQRSSNIYFTHKRCCRAFEQANGGDIIWAAMPLEYLPIYLMGNLKIDFEKAKHGAWFMQNL